MYCKLDLSRERKFNYIRFYHGNSYETPLKWRMYFFSKNNTPIQPYGHEHRYIETGDPETTQGAVAIIVKLKQPISARWILL